MIAYILSTVREDKKREWRTKLLPSKIEEVMLNLPHVLSRIFEYAPVFQSKKDAVRYVKEFVKKHQETYTICHLKRDFTIFSMSDMEDNVNPYAHECGDCGSYPSVSYTSNSQTWNVSCTNVNCLNGCITVGNRMYLAVNEWNKEQQKRQYLAWRDNGKT
jgi:hypothetical protein